MRIIISIIVGILIISSCNFIDNFINTFGKNKETNNTSYSFGKKGTIVVDQDGGGDYTRIQDAINYSSDGDVIEVYYGNYSEELIINKSITLNGIEKPLLYLNKYNSYNIKIESKCVIINNFFIRNYYGLYSTGFEYKKSNNILIKSSNITINQCTFNGQRGIETSDIKNSDMMITNCYFNTSTTSIQTLISNVSINNNIFNNYYISNSVIKLNPSNNIIISNNIFNGNFYFLGAGDALISAYNGPITNVYIFNNTFLKSNYGFWGIIANSIIEKNIFKLCNHTSILGNDNKIINNYFFNIRSSIIFGGKNCNISNNSFINNSHGIEIASAKNIMIFKNNISLNKIGIRVIGDIDYSSYVNIYDNFFYKNKVGIVINDTKDSVVYQNRFIENELQASANGINYGWNAKYPLGGNYWSDYKGTKDILKGVRQDEPGSDGFGDEPYILGNVKDNYPLFTDMVLPRADGGIDVTIDQGYVYRFNSTRSTDDQMIDRVRWEFEYGGELKEFDMFEFDFKFDMSGFYPVKLTVYDFPGNSDTTTFNITVKDLTAPEPMTQGDIIIRQGETAFFNASSSIDNSGIVNYTWTFQYEEEYIQLYGMTTSFKFDIPGYYTVTLLLKDTAENFASIKFNVTVIDTERPKAVAGEDVEIENGESVLFDASLSTDNGILVGFNWSFDYDGQIVHLEGKLTSFDFVKPGHYEVMLNVSDQFGNHDVDSLLVTVMDTHPPEAVIKGTLVQNPGGTIRLNGLSSTDNGRIVRYHWDFTDLGPIKVEGPYLNHTFERKGRHNVTLTVYDEWNLSGDVTTIVDILDQQKPIAAAGDDATIPARTLFTFNASGSIDDGMIVRYRWTFQYDGEETRFDGEKVQFRFDKGGTYNVLLTVTDQTGNWGEDGMVLTVVDKGTLKGTVLNKNGSPLKGAKITVRASDGRDYLGISSANGSFIVDVFMGDATYKITKPGYKSVSGAVTIRPMETTVLDSAGTTLEPASRTGLSPLLFIIAGIGVGLLIAGLVLFFILRRKKEGTEGAASDTTNGSEPSDGPEGPKIEEDGNVEGPVEGEPPVEEMFKAHKEEEILIEDAGHLTEQMDEFFNEVESETGEVKQQ